VVLIDAGWGDKQDEKFFKFVYQFGGEGLIKGLAGVGYKPEDITDVFFTHLHADHCGGALRRGPGGIEHVFPNAKYHISRQQWEWAVKGNLREADSFLPENILPLGEGDRLRLVESDGELFPGFEARICEGHTPGLMYALVDFRGRRLAYVGDLIPTVGHLPLIWNSAYEINPLRSIDEKERLLVEALENNYILVFQHDEHVECCDLQSTPKGIRAKTKFPFANI